MSDPLVSVYMTVRDGLPYVAEAVESVRQQTFADWELIVVDDGSRDGTGDYLAGLPSADDRIRVIPTAGVGRAVALNLALAQARGFYVANLDADDLAHPQRLEIQLGLMRRHRLQYLASASQFIRDAEAVRWCTVDEGACEVADRSRRLLRRNPINHSSVIMERRLCQAVGGYDEHLSSQLDYDLWYRLCRAGCPIMRSTPALVAKRLHARQSFERRRRLHYLWHSYRVQRRVIAGLGGAWPDRLYMILRLCMGLVPAGIRLSRR
ncbi:glycosyltransferase family 2 protein [Billgrantia lactosivorans]|uniref:glycosyltransferase family 2 protein n=1 Tax=Billgrantia lactosivorans TaxID=2185141 RepID=UPI000DADCCBF|nr:glycosyltransferase family 2 protein [Halomonas lactosivorans]